VGDVMKSFLNDADGLSLYEFMALLIIGAFIGITLLILAMVLMGKEVTQMLSFYQTFIQVPTTVVAGIFLQGTAREVMNRRAVNKIADDAMGKDNSYGYYGDYSHSDVYSESEYHV
jgi:hypothetical protein